MGELASLPSQDVRRIVDSALAGLDMKLSPVGERDIVAGLERDLRFDHESSRFVILDEAGNPRVDIDAAGTVQDVSLSDHLRALASKQPASFTEAVRAGTPENPFKVGSTFSRTKQAILTIADAEAAARMKAEATAGDGDPANPWSTAGWSRTKQAVLTNTKPDEAKRLREESGQ